MGPLSRLNPVSLGLVILLSCVATAQNSQSYLNDLGSTSYGVNIPVENGFINISNGNLHLEFALAAQAQRGALSLSERITYDSRIWEFSPFGSNGSYHWWPYNVPGTSTSSGGWQFVKSNEIGSITYSYVGASTFNCPGGSSDGSDPPQETAVQQSVNYIDANGTLHPTNAIMTSQDPDGGGTAFGDGCTSSQSLSPGNATDGSGYSIQVDQNGNPLVIDSSGTQVYPQVIDRYGNFYSADGNGNLVDSAGRVPVIMTQNGNTTYYDVLSPNGTINNNGARVRYTVTTASISVSTQFNQSDTYDWTGPYLTPVQSIGLPDGTQYSFTYDSYGGLASMTLPTGGVVSYAYSNFLDSSNTENRWLTSRTVDNGTTTFTPAVVTSCSNYTTGCVEKVTQHKPSGDETVYQLTLNNGAWNTAISAYTGQASNGQQLLQTTNVDTYTNGCTAPGCYSANYLSQSVSTTTLYPTGVQSQTQSFFNQTDGKPSSVKQWDFIASGQSFASSPDRETDYAYTGHDLQQVTLYDPNRQQVSQTTYSYTSSATATSGITQHGTANAGGPYLQKVSQWLNTSNTTLDQTVAYDDTGTLLSSTDPNGTTTYGHDGADIFTTSVTFPVPASGILLSTSATYDTNSGVLLTQTDVNGTKTVRTGFDVLNRPTEIDVQDLNSNLVGKTTYSYGSNQMGVHPYLTSSVAGDTETLYDAYGRPSRTAVYNGQSSNPWYQQDVCYDSSGRPAFQATSYQGSGFSTTAQVCSGSSAGVTTAYDALGRPVSVTNADGTVQYAYTGRAVRKTDVNGVQTITQTDAFGRITGVCEISSNSLAGESPAPCGMDIAGTGYVTSYSYSLASHTTTIVQGPLTPRTFQTDSLGRTIAVTEPERGNTTYSYTYMPTGNNGGLQVTRSRPKANQLSGSTFTKTTTQYDNLGRVVSVSYDDGVTVPKYFYYDSSPSWLQWSTTPQNTRGRLAGTLSNSGGPTSRTQLSYDAVGDVTTMWQCAPSVCGTSSQESRPALQFGYDLAGNLTYEFDGASGGISYGRSPAGEVTSIYNNNYQDQYNPPNLVSNIVNTPFGPATWTIGNGLNVARTYDSMGRNQGNYLCIGSPTANCSGELYGDIQYYKGVQVTGLCDTVVNQCQNHIYDEFNRLTAVNGTSSFAWSYDRWGNRLTQSGSPSVGFSYGQTSNRNLSFGYDAPGNQTNDALHSYQYDAEGNVLSVDNGSTAQYVYDAMNNRVRVQTASSTYEYLFDPSGHRMSSWLLTGSGGGFGNEGRIWWGGSLLATRDWNGQTYFHHSDWLGTERMRTNVQGQVATTSPSRAFGDGFSQSSSDSEGAAQDNNEFAGQDLDSESGTDHAQFRQYSPTQGQWMSPDPYDGSYDYTNPQSLNRYSYVNNDPFSFNDPSGLDGDDKPPTDWQATVVELAGAALTIGISYAVDKAVEAIAGLFAHPQFTASHTSRPGQIWDESGAYHPQPYSGPADILNLGTQGCEFGACGGGPSDFTGNNPLAVGGPIIISPTWVYSLINLFHFPYADASDPNHRLGGTHYCGPGGGGGTTGGLDGLCAAHDACYRRSGVSAIDNLNPFTSGAAMGGCDRLLCASLSQYSPTSRQEGVLKGQIQQVFGCGYINK